MQGSGVLECCFSIHQVFDLNYTMTKSAKIFYCTYECLKYGELVGIKIIKMFIVLVFIKYCMNVV